MFDYVQNNKTIQIAMKGLLGLIALGFVGFGSYSFIDHQAAEVAKVGDVSITQLDVQRMLQMRNAGPEKSAEVINELVQRTLMMEKARELGLRVSDDDLKKALLENPSFQKNGRFDKDTYYSIVHSNDMTPEQFETRLREDLLLQRMQDVLVKMAEGGFSSRKSNDALATFVGQQRPVSTVRIEASSFMDKVQVSDAEIGAYYKANSGEFRLPEQVRVEYVLLSVSGLAAAQSVTDEEVTKYYESNRSQFERDERQARHLLILAPANDEAARKAARERIAGLLQQARANPDGFAELAKANSQDPGTAQQGGDLGWLSQKIKNPGFKPLIDGLFKLQGVGSMDVVESPYGFHIVQLAGERKAGLNEARGDITTLLKEQKARRAYPQISDQISELALSNERNLAPVAQAVRLPLQTSGWIGRDGLKDDPVFGPANKDVLDAVFSPDGVAGRSSDIIELPGQQRVVARVVEHKPARLQTLAEVTPTIRLKLQTKAAARLAEEEGKRQLAILEKGGALPTSWSNPAPVSRLDGGALSEQAVKVAMGLPAKASYGGVAENNGYTLINAGPVIAAPVDPRMLEGLQRMRLAGEVDAYFKAMQREMVQMAPSKAKAEDAK